MCLEAIYRATPKIVIMPLTGKTPQKWALMTMIYDENDGNTAILKGKTVAVIGYGDTGQAFALNMRDSGIDVLVSPHTSAESDVAETHQIPIASGICDVGTITIQ